jgi:hypothetical protein
VEVEVGIFYQNKLPRTCHSPLWKGYSSVLVSKGLARYLRNAGRMGWGGVGWVNSWCSYITYQLQSVQEHLSHHPQAHQNITALLEMHSTQRKFNISDTMWYELHIQNIPKYVLQNFNM